MSGSGIGGEGVEYFPESKLGVRELILKIEVTDLNSGKRGWARCCVHNEKAIGQTAYLLTNKALKQVKRSFIAGGIVPGMTDLALPTSDFIIPVESARKMGLIPKEYPAGYNPLEDEEQADFVAWLHREYPEFPFFAVPNGGWRHPRTAGRLKATGVSPGVPDLVFPFARGGFHGLFIEMKRRKGGHVEESQKAWKKTLEDNLYLVEIAHGAEEAKKAFWAYIHLGTFAGAPK